MMKNPLLTWLDVQRALKRHTENFRQYPENIVSISCFPDGAEIEFSGDVSYVTQWLESIFGKFIAQEGKAVSLIGEKHYPFDLIKVDALKKIIPFQYPLWQEQVYIEKSLSNLPEKAIKDLPIATFHSFKGGVGRTTALMTYVAGLLAAKDRKIKLLLVDADLEAPGISLWLEDANKPTVSFIGFLEALQYPSKDINTTINYFASELSKTSFNVEGINREIFVLPAALELTEVMDMPVLPEHLARNPENPWQLTDYLYELGKVLRVDMIFVDLRAGLTELSSPLLFDPRIEHFFVTTVAPQSIKGTAAILKQIYQMQNTTLGDDQNLFIKPSIILGPMTSQLKQLSDYAVAIEALNDAYPLETDELVSESLDIIEVDFDPGLMSIGSMRHALDILNRSTLFQGAREWASGRLSVTLAPEENVSVHQKGDAKKLHELCNKLQFAEVSENPDMLVTEPLRNLAKHYTNELPNVVSVGAKGAGKTFTYLQLCKNRTWRNFLTGVGVKASSVDGNIHPLMSSNNLGESARKQAQNARENSLGALSHNMRSDSKSLIPAALKNDATDWDNFWEKFIISDLGFNPEIMNIHNVNDKLREMGKSVVLIIDGIEDRFENPENENQKAAIKALLQLPNMLSDLKSSHIGLICFMRIDYVQAAIRQNVAQYVARFEAFRLEWNPENFLRLVYWICAKAGIIGADADEAEKMTSVELLLVLEKLWGKKLGRDNAKEAVTARWVFSALCDFNGRLQARDIVRFLKIAAKNATNAKSDLWKDRLLAPEVIRHSLPECSREKVSEAVLEIAALRTWVEILKAIPPEIKKSPFRPDALGLDGVLLSSLHELGIIYEDTEQVDKRERFYLPEIYRSGLDFQSAAGGRPRVQALLKRNLGEMPF